jgi:signal transduction histidine kinase
VTSRPAGGTSAAERKRQSRERQRVAERQTYFSRTDWSLFLNPRTISQKAGCQPADLRKLALRELVDNGADASADNVIIYPEGDGWIISDDGPGLDPDDVPHLFSVNRTLVSSKQLRLPTRGMVGNGLRVVMGAVAVFEGSINGHDPGPLYAARCGSGNRLYRRD